MTINEAIRTPANIQNIKTGMKAVVMNSYRRTTDNVPMLHVLTNKGKEAYWVAVNTVSI